MRQFRESRGWTTTDLAREVGTFRQNIENLEGGSVTLPSYIVALADVMDTSTDELLGRERQPPASAREQATALYEQDSPADALLAHVGRVASALDPARRAAFANTLRDWLLAEQPEPYRDMLRVLLQSAASLLPRRSH